MAIDTAEKRKSVSGVGFPPLIPGVTSNASQDQEWRQESAWSYSGILAGAPPAVVPGGQFHIIRRRRRRVRDSGMGLPHDDTS